MSKLLERLQDPVRSGVYRVTRSDVIDEVMRDAAQIDLKGGDALHAVAQALRFPDWFGGNWDALEDCLSDLSWMTARGYVLLIEGAAEVPLVERGTLVDILASAAASWAERKRPFFAVFLDGPAALSELYNARR